MFKNFHFIIYMLVVINPAHRGKGYGRVMMEGCEEFAVKLRFSTIYLSTHDKKGFYTKLGFRLCAPVCHFGSGATLSVNKVN